MIAYDGVANPATRLRALQFVPMLEQGGFDVRTLIYPQGAVGILDVDAIALWREARAADVVVVQRVLSTWMNLLLRASRRPVVFDVDDALQYIRQSQYASALAPRTLRDRALVLYRTIARGSRFYSARRRPLRGMLRLADAIVAGNRALATEFSEVNDRVVVLPTAVPVETYPARTQGESRPVRIGWIGVPSNLFHLELLRETFAELARRYGDDVRLVIVSSRGVEGLPIATEFVQWTLETESEQVSRFDIGIMPLHDDFFSRGKCSFKAIYCMAHGVPVVISPVGMNAELVEHGVNGFLASDAGEWTAALSALIDDVALRSRMGAAARRTIEREYGSRRVFDGLSSLLAEVSDKSSSQIPHQGR
jgi:glycosyltransferase involved in cell wall biosynthesis